jgi:hypothetical protein
MLGQGPPRLGQREGQIISNDSAPVFGGTGITLEKNVNLFRPITGRGATYRKVGIEDSPRLRVQLRIAAEITRPGQGAIQPRRLGSRLQC